MPYVVVAATNNTPDVKLGVDVQFQKSGVFNSLTLTAQQAIANLKNLLLTRIGERYNLPLFGSRLTEILFQPSNEFTKQDINEAIREAVSLWAPYIVIENIDVTTAQDDPMLQHDIQIVITVNGENITINASENGSILIE